MSETARGALREVEFTRDWYRDFLEFLSGEYRFRSFRAPPEEGEIVLRHDVDLSVEDALTMARIEADHDVQATYFLLVSSRLYNPLQGDTRERIREIRSLGHDVGLHFSTHQHWPSDDPPDPAELRERVADEQTVLETVVPDAVSTVSFHVPPAWVLDRSFEGIDSAYDPAFYSAVEYTSDSGQRWRGDPPFCDLPAAAQVLVHPGLWGEDDATFGERVDRAIDRSCLAARAQARRDFLGGNR